MTNIKYGYDNSMSVGTKKAKKCLFFLERRIKTIIIDNAHKVLLPIL